MLAAVLASTGENVGWGAVMVALIGLLTAWTNRKYGKLETKNDQQHARGYDLLQSIDTRTIAMDSKLDNHGERIAVVENEVKNLKPQKVALEATPGGHVVATVESPHKESNVTATAGAEAGTDRGSGAGA